MSRYAGATGSGYRDRVLEIIVCRFIDISKLAVTVTLVELFSIKLYK